VRLLEPIKKEAWGIGGMAFGGVLAARAGIWLIDVLRHPVPRTWPVAIMALLFVIGAAIAVWGARLYHRIPTPD
jgi:hypothetical protein